MNRLGEFFRQASVFVYDSFPPFSWLFRVFVVGRLEAAFFLCAVFVIVVGIVVTGIGRLVFVFLVGFGRGTGMFRGCACVDIVGSIVVIKGHFLQGIPAKGFLPVGKGCDGNESLQVSLLAAYDVPETGIVHV